MIKEFPIDRGMEILPLFKKHKYLRLLLEGLIKEKTGTIHVNNLDNPSVALVSKQIVFFLAGSPDDPAATALLKQIPSQRLIFAPTEEWISKMKEFWNDKLKPYPRTKFSSKDLDINQMHEIQKMLPEELAIEKVTNELIEKISTQAKNVISLTFPSLDDFMKSNFGFCILDDKKIASLALAASPIYEKHFEIHIETDPEYQRKGLALISCAKLIEYSLYNDLVPHWDADNEPSAKLALKLGFTQPEKYNCYLWLEPKK
jgi:RimJ/RimL family protein N-acetyltransferase